MSVWVRDRKSFLSQEHIVIAMLIRGGMFGKGNENSEKKD